MGTRCLLMGLPLLLAGCGGAVRTQPIPPGALQLSEACRAAAPGTSLDQLPPGCAALPSFEGVAAFRAMPAVRVSLLTQYTNDAKVLSGQCTQVTTRELVTIPDTANPIRVFYRGGWFDSNTLNVTLNGDGVLTAVNSTTTPDQGKTLEATAETVAKLVAVAAVLGAPLSARVATNGLPTDAGPAAANEAELKRQLDAARRELARLRAAGPPCTSAPVFQYFEAPSFGPQRAGR